MSNTSYFYLKSDTSINGEIDLVTYAYNDYELTIYPVNERALNVSTTKNQVEQTITFNNLIRYDFKNRKINEWKNNTWNEVTNYFDSNYTGIKIYQNNLYTSIKTDISFGTIDINKPWFYMMYGPSSSEDVSRVTSIVFQNNIYSFTSDIGKVEFDIKGNPIRSLTTTNLQTVPSLRFVVFRYNGFSQMTSSYLNNLYNTLPNVQSCKNGDTQYVYYSGCGVNISQYNIYIYGQSITSVYPNGNGQRTVHKIYKNLNDPNWDLLFFISDDGSTDKGIAFKLDGTPVKAYQRRSDGWGQWDITPDVGYRIYRKDGFTNFTPTASTKVIPIDIITITKDITYQRVNPTIDNFQITIPIDKPTNRIFVYQSDSNKLVHITDYIPKGTTQNVYINYTQGVNGITSSVTPLNPLSVPNFWHKETDNTSSNGEIIGNDGVMGKFSYAICDSGSLVKIGRYGTANGCLNIYIDTNNDAASSTSVYNGYSHMLSKNYDGNFINCNKNNINGKIRSIQDLRFFLGNKGFYYQQATCVYPSIR